ncbi:energy transducer TonB [Sulfuriferula multivorans]|uniref:energy transducer TonB n=1 Tax=Sulfuriferula multivorans TaxID=1559896 RepID=UPI000F5C00D6|nr:energy transducer TonB [Sulfuriferula multivorans]
MNSAVAIDPPVQPINPWWPLPLALVLWALMLWGFGFFFAAPAKVASIPPAPIDARIIELPPPPAPPKLQPKPVVKAEKVARPVPVVRPTPQAVQTPPPAPKVALPTPPAPVPAPTHAEPAPVPPPPKPEPSPSTGQGGTQQMGARALYQPKPTLPEDLRDETIHTVVMARFHIKPDGSATVELTQAAPNPRVNQLILNTLKTWRFFPAIQAGKPVASVQDVKVAIDVE